MEARAKKILHHIDLPQRWETLPPCLWLRGWCFLADRRHVQGVRVRVRDLCFVGAIGLPRPDVSAVFPDAPDTFTGFEIRGLLPAGRMELTLEARLPDGSWHLLATHRIKVARRLRPLWLGGGDWHELMLSQVPSQMQYPPRPLQPERFPQPTSDSAHRPDFSIVTPSWQQARFLPEAIGSVLGQRGVRGNYFIQDGGSTDGSADLIRLHPEQAGPSNSHRAAADPPATLFPPAMVLAAAESARDGGQADAIKRGFSKSSGAPDDLMAWINSDDFYLPGAFAFVAGYFARHPQVDVIYGHRILVDETSREIGRWFLPAHDDTVLRLYDFVPQETMFWRRRIWDRVGGLDSTFKFAMDWDLLLRFQAAGARIVRVPYFLACFRVHAAQKTSAAMHDVGQPEIDRLRTRTFQRAVQPRELEQNPRLHRYLRRSALCAGLWRLGLRTP